MPAETFEYATPQFPLFEDCYFYHRMTLPDVGDVGKEWDLRPTVEAYLGYTNFAGKRVLEIGPASGFLTAHMERAGAEVVSIDLPVAYGWDFVPRPNVDRGGWREHMQRLQNGFWFAHAKFGLKSKVIYARVQDLPDSIGKFDIAIIASVLIHSRDPMGIICRCAELTTQRIVVTESAPMKINAPFPIMVLRPTMQNTITDSWWTIPSETISTILQVLGFTKTVVTETPNYFVGAKDPMPSYTVAAERP
jgi:O-methyltransferase